MTIVLGVTLILLFIIVSIYNGLINKKNSVKESESSVDVMLKKRHDLIPNLVAAVQKYMQHEKGVLTEITQLRTQLKRGGLSEADKFALENTLTSKLSGIMVSVENYPDLKASDNFQQLQRALNEIEEQISASRRSYNAAVKSLNNCIEMFPSSIVAGMMNLEKRPFFEITNIERANPDVSTLFS